MNVVIYARYSSLGQTEQSIEGQLKVCREFAKRNNYIVVGEYIDRAWSGTNDKRPQFQKMIEDSNKKQFQGVIVYQLDRFSRNKYDSAVYKEKLKRNEVRVFSAKENISEDASGVLMESLLEGMAEYFSAELSQKVKRGMDISAEKFQYTGSAVPLGFKIDENKKYQINEEKKWIIEKIFDMYIEGQTIIEIVRYLNERNILNEQNRKFNRNYIQNILSNKKYIGTYVYKGKENPNAIPAIIDIDTFEKAQTKLSKNVKAPARTRATTEYLLTTKLFCGKCKEMMTGTSGTSRSKKRYNYYTCNGIKKNGCTKKNVQKEYIENLVLKHTKEILTEENIDKIAREVVKLASDKEKNHTVEYLEKQLHKLEKERNNLLDSLKVCTLNNVRQTIFQELNNMEKKCEELQQEISIETINTISVTIPQVKFFLTKLKDGDINDKKYQKMLINIFVDKIYLYDDKLIIYFNINESSCEKEVTIDEIECSFFDTTGTPKSCYTNQVYFADGFAILIELKK